MKTKSQSVKKTSTVLKPRIVLCVDPDASYTGILHDAWSQLRLADDLHVADSRETAMAYLDSTCSKKRPCSLAAVVLDPEATGEETGPFVREVRKRCGKHPVPVVFWSQDSDKYNVLEGRGIESVLKKPMVLRLIQALDALCQLRVQSFLPYSGKSAIAPSPLNARLSR